MAVYKPPEASTSKSPSRLGSHKQVKELPWNSLERIAQMMLPLPDPAEIKYYKPSFQGY